MKNKLMKIAVGITVTVSAFMITPAFVNALMALYKTKTWEQNIILSIIYAMGICWFALFVESLLQGVHLGAKALKANFR